MSVVVFTAVTGTPGVTTATIASGVHWDRPVLVVEADTSNVGSVMTGFFRGGLDATAGMHQVSLALSRRALNAEALLDPDFGIAIPVHELPRVPQMPIPTIPAGHRMWVIPGYRDLGTLDGVRDVWDRLPHLFAALHQVGIDVLVDLGRLTRDDPRLVVLDAADQVVVLASATMTDLNRLHKRVRLPDLDTRLHGSGGDRWALLLTDPAAEPVAARDFGRSVMPVIATTRLDPAGAAVFAHGREDPKPSRNGYRADIRRTVLALRHRITGTSLALTGPLPGGVLR